MILFLGGISRGTPPRPPVSLEAFSRPVNSGMGMDSTFTGLKVVGTVRIVCQDHVIVDFFWIPLTA
jgi:hypothetical protein